MFLHIYTCVFVCIHNLYSLLHVYHTRINKPCEKISKYGSGCPLSPAMSLASVHKMQHESKEICAKPYFINRNNVRKGMKNNMPDIHKSSFNSFNDFIYDEQKDEIRANNKIVEPVKRDVSSASSTLNNISSLYAYHSVSNEKLT
ncbi:alpha/beta hydrolase, putative [Plasmodium malariae]|uniref:Alpha/beta hydrolase, putative n=1 Tax=Plasmodium malariae TaxID=5858 RepID=A0A1C3KA26_PLAMA|nr:alpha/beta hydrolase, putative [Plasmodium malariae]